VLAACGNYGNREGVYPNPAFCSVDHIASLAHVWEVAFAPLIMASDDPFLVAHVPLIVADGALWLHLANSNAITALLPGRKAVTSAAVPRQ
jgi:predicted FMN-binding regulatory protein PaiB